MDAAPALTEFVRANAFAAGLLIGALTFVDGLVLAGLVMNGWALFVVCVYCYANGYVSIVNIIGFAFFGVFAAEQLSFYLGLRGGPLILRSIGLLATNIETLKKSSTLNTMLFWISEKSWDRSLQRISVALTKWGGLALIIGRWTPIASLVPALCATLSMPYVRFTTFSFASCLLWVLAWTLIVHVTVKGYSAFTGVL